MAYTINHNSTDHTGASADVTLSLYSKDSSDYTITNQGVRPASTVLSNLDSGLSTPETYQFQFSRIPNIYLNSDVEKVLQAPSRTGIKLYHNVKQTWSYRDASGQLPDYDKPISGSIVLNIPNDGIITVADVRSFLEDMVASFWWDGSLRLERELRGSTNPLSD